MKEANIFKHTVAAILLVVTLAGCKSDELLPQQPVTAATLEFPMINSFQEIDAGSGGSWSVTDYPEWAAPMEESGDGNTPIQLFVETNDSDDDRTATITVRHADGNESVYNIMQHGAISNIDNGTELSEIDLNKTYGVGYTTNVFATSQTEKYYISAFTPLNFRKFKTAMDNIGESDAMIDENRYYSRVETVTGSSTSAIANQLSINAGIEVGISGFKGSIEGGYSKTSDSNEQYEYALEEIQHIVGSRQLRPGVLRYFVENDVNIFQSDFNKHRKALAKNPADTKTMDLILKNYGTHVITQGTLGGELKLSMQMKVTDSSSSSDIHAALGIGSKVINVEGEFNMKKEEKAIASNTTISLVTYGGNNVYTIAPGATFESFQKVVKDKSNLKKWVSGIVDRKSLALIDLETIPIYELMPTEASRDALRNYIVGPYQEKMYSTDDNPYPGPDLYVIKGFENAEDGKSAYVYIPEIDIEIQSSRCIISELSSSEYSTVVYSGNIGSVDKNKGFFLGSATRKPCKFKRERNGNFSVEEFDRLNTAMLTELYVDAMGDVTISPKGATDLYRTVSMDNWCSVHDISNLFKAYLEISNPTALTGKFCNRFLTVILKPDVTLTLRNAEFCGQIICEGNANIFVDSTTKNKIFTYRSTGESNYDYVAIVAGPRGSKLNLSGDGSLDVAGGGCAIGINGSSTCGDISINVGDLTATGINGPGIGAHNNSVCGNIEVTGGHVTARSLSDFSAAIGISQYATCGDIFISRNIKGMQVSISHQGGQSIGLGYAYGKCGKITIEDRSKVRSVLDTSGQIPLL